MRKVVLSLAAPFFAVLLSSVALGQAAEVHRPLKSDVSPPLRELHPAPSNSTLPRDRPLLKIPRPAGAGAFQPDPAAQRRSGPSPRVATTSGLDILGQGYGFSGPQGGFTVEYAPPDPTGAAGKTQYVQWVNTKFSVFDKATGAVLYGPVNGNTLFSGFGGPCEFYNDGDPIVQYDSDVNRWVLTQFAISGGSPYYQCVAVSLTPDATGPYARYAYAFTYFNDYPKLGVWPDGYYLSFNNFADDGFGNFFFVGAMACAMDRKKMLAAQPASIQCVQLDGSIDSLLPSDQEGPWAPVVGSPNYYMNFGFNSLRMWKYHVDFNNPANSTFTGPTTIPVAAFTPACNGGTCIPQSGTTTTLDSLADRLMYRLVYRNFGVNQPESLLVNHSVMTAGGRSGIRWYEIRNPRGTPAVYQQGTFAPDANYRWMGSIAMDRAGDIAVGYSVSSAFMFPGIRYTGRTPADPLGTLQSENTIVNGGGSQTFGLSRWGDYSHMMVDPSDDCTMWYTNEYLQYTGSFNWSTRIASFRFPNCPGGNVVDETPFFVRQQYVDVLRRDADQGGFDGWSNYINQCGTDPTCLNEHRIGTARGFLESLEFRYYRLCLDDNNCTLWNYGPTDDVYMQEYVRQLYLVYLRREPEPSGYNAWLNYIRSTGGSNEGYNNLVGGFINSTEYRLRFGQ